MRAVVLRDGRLEVRETPDPVPGPGQLLVRTLSTAICASDVHYMDHAKDIVDGAGRMLYDEDRDVVMGHEFVGELVGYGPECAQAMPIGTRVTSMPVLLVAGGGRRIIGQHPEAVGSFGEMFVVSESMARPVPAGVPDDAVALVDAFAVGEFYVRSSGITVGHIPIVIGAGAIGLSAVAALAHRGIAPIVVSDFNAARLALAEQFGASVFVDPAVRQPFDVWAEVAHEHGVTTPPVVFECVGAPGLIQEIVDACPYRTRIHAAGGWYTGDSLNCTAATNKGVTVQFGGGPGVEDWYGTLDAVCEGRLDPRPSIGRIVGLDEVPEALDLTRKAQGPPRIIVHPHA